jgi:hypothetical protein
MSLDTAFWQIVEERNLTTEFVFLTQVSDQAAEKIH